MRNLYLLTGAGFSRNWGGWLASEAFEYLIGCDEIQGNRRLVDLLWEHQQTGGFEGAIGTLQGQSDSDAKECLAALMAAVGNMFADMNSGFLGRRYWFQDSHKNRRLEDFLGCFDVIFTLNQDILIEHLYMSSTIFNSARRWSGCVMPGVSRYSIPENVQHQESSARATWSPQVPKNFKIEKGFQQYIKLHGSSNWVLEDGDNLLIVGSGKERAIQREPLLDWYHKLYRESLCQPEAKLMIIGYGFNDPHINESIRVGIHCGLKLFIVTKEGAQSGITFYDAWKGPQILEDKLGDGRRSSVVGASRRDLSEILDQESEFNKLKRFVES